MVALKLKSILTVLSLILIGILGSGLITMNVSAADVSAVEEPFTLDAAPHFSSAAYILQDPTYLQRFDGLGEWKISTGSPKVTVDDSQLNFQSFTSSMVQLTLASDDVDGLNSEPRNYMEIKVKTSSVAAGDYTNVSLSNGALEYARLSMNGGDLDLAYTMTTGAIGVAEVYGTIANNTWYRLAIEVSTDTLTYYCYEADGDLLANYIITDAELISGAVTELRLSLTGGPFTANYDWVYFASDSPVSGEYDTTSGDGIETLAADSSASEDGMKVDPTLLDYVRSGSAAVNEALGISDWDWDDCHDVNASNLITAFGNTPEMSQRLQGTYYAAGWSNLRSQMEAALINEIATVANVEGSDVTLIDYYVDYLQIQTVIDNTLTNNLQDRFTSSLERALDATGVEYDSTGGSQQLSVYSIVGFSDDRFGLTFEGFSNDITGGANLFEDLNIEFEDPAQMMEGMVRWVVELVIGTGADAASDNAQEIIDAIVEGLNGMYTTQFELWYGVLNSTLEKFAGVFGESMGGILSFCQGTVQNITGYFDKQFQSVIDLNNEYITWSQEQFQATNAMFSQLFSQMTESINEMQRTFASQLAATNAIITNITSTVTGLDDMWASVLSDGKVSNSALTLSGLFDEELTSNEIIIIVIIVISIIAVVTFLALRSGKHSGGKRRR